MFLTLAGGRTICQRLVVRYDGRPPTPQQVLAEEPKELKAAVGLSRGKVGFLRSLAEHVLDGSLKLARWRPHRTLACRYLWLTKSIRNRETPAGGHD